MADSAILIVKVRMNINDYPYNPADETSKADIWYEYALDTALKRLNADTCSSYSISTLPVNWEWVIILLATLELSYSKVNTDPSSSSKGALKRLDIEGLETEYYNTSLTDGKDWVNFIRDLEDRYQKFLDKFQCGPDLEDTLSDVINTTVNTPSARYGGALRHRTLDRGVSAPSDLAVATHPNGVLLTWTPVYNSQFRYYAIERIEDGTDFDDENNTTLRTVVHIHDNHDKRFIDKSPLSSGVTYLYRISVFNRNFVKNESSSVSYTKV